MSVWVETSKSENKINIQYPILAKEKEWEMIVLFTSETTLIVLEPGLSDHSVGDYKIDCFNCIQNSWEILPKDFVVSIIQQ